MISSKDNEFIKHVKKLKDKKYRDLSNEYIIEGIKLIEVAIKEEAQINQIVICDDCEKTQNIPKNLMYEIAKYECVYVANKVFNTISQVNSPEGIFAVVEKNNKNKQIDYKQDIIIALDNIQDPGNLGTILRTADSIGLNQILVSKGTVDVYNPKVVRSTMGAIFRVKVIECEDIVKAIKETKKHKFKLVVTTPNTQDTIYNINYNKKVIAIGNEANGVSKEI